MWQRAGVDLKCLPLGKLITALAHCICHSRRHQVVFYLMTDGVYRTVHLVLRLYLSSGCCRRSFIKAPEDSLPVLLDKYLFSITMKFPSVCFSVTVRNDWSWNLLPLVDHTTEALHSMACSGPAALQTRIRSEPLPRARSHTCGFWMRRSSEAWRCPLSSGCPPSFHPQHSIKVSCSRLQLLP